MNITNPRALEAWNNRPSKSRLDVGNIGILADFFLALHSSHKNFDDVIKALTAKDSLTVKQLKAHDTDLYLMLRTWAQSTEHVMKAVDQRLREMNDILTLYPEVGEAVRMQAAQEEQAVQADQTGAPE